MSPESCLDGPRGRGEALTWESTGVVLSSDRVRRKSKEENTPFRRPSQWAGAKATRSTAYCESSDAPAESKTNACVDVFHTGIGITRKGVRA